MAYVCLFSNSQWTEIVFSGGSGLVAQSCPTPCDPMGRSLPWDFPGKYAGADCHLLLQGIFPPQEVFLKGGIVFLKGERREKNDILQHGKIILFKIIWNSIVFVHEESFVGIQPYPFVYILSMAGLHLNNRYE